MKININPANYYNSANQASVQQNFSTNDSVRVIGMDAAATQPQIKTESEKDDSNANFHNKPKQELTMDEKAWMDMIEKANKAIAGSYCNFEYSIHEKTKQIMVKVIDRDSKEVIREIPPEKVLDMVAYMWELAGVIVDERR